MGDDVIETLRWQVFDVTCDDNFYPRLVFDVNDDADVDDNVNVTKSSRSFPIQTEPSIKWDIDDIVESDRFQVQTFSSSFIIFFRILTLKFSFRIFYLLDQKCNRTFFGFGWN